MKPVRACRVYYGPDDCSTEWHDGIIVVVAYEEPPYRRILANSDWYWRAGDYCGTLGDFAEQSTHAEPGQWLDPQPILDAFPDAQLAKGIWTDDATYEATRQAALAAEAP